MAEILEHPEVDELLDEKVQELLNHHIVIYNDDHNTFDHVVDILMKYCKHAPEQAEQCTLIIHFKGKCSVKEGDLKELNEIKKAICEAGIDAKVE